MAWRVVRRLVVGCGGGGGEDVRMYFTLPPRVVSCRRTGPPRASVPSRLRAHLASPRGEDSINLKAMVIMGAMLLCYLVTTLYSIGVSGVSLNNCDGLMCPENTYCSVSSTMIDGRQQTVRTCSDMGGNVVARSISGGEAGYGNNRRSNVVHSSNVVMSGGGGGCIHHVSSINGITTNTYRCGTDGDNAYYVTNTNGVYKNCTTIPVASDSGTTTAQEHCVPMSPEDIQRVKDMEEEIQRKAEEVKQRMAGMAWDMQAQNQGIHNRMMANMGNMQQNMQNMFDESMRRAARAGEEMLQTAEDVQRRVWNTASRAQAQSQAVVLRTLENIENSRRNMENSRQNMENSRRNTENNIRNTYW